MLKQFRRLVMPAIAMAAVASDLNHSAAYAIALVPAADTAAAEPNDNRRAAGVWRDGTLHVVLTTRPARWQPEGKDGPTAVVFAFAEDSGPPRIPGPLLRVPAGSKVDLTVRNALEKPLRLYGLHHRPATAVDSFELAPGASRRLQLQMDAPGTYFYWGRTTRDTFPIGIHEDGQLSGAIVVDSVGTGGIPPDDRIFVIGLWQSRHFPPGTPVTNREETLVFNGLAWPHSERLSGTVGDSIRWRVINASRRLHPLHLHGFYFRVDARGTPASDTAYGTSQRRIAVTERLPPGTTMSLAWSPHTAGNWLFHCHLVEHFNARMQPDDRPVTQHQNHALDAMSGLVLGIGVKPRPGEAEVALEPPRRTLRLFVTERPRIFGEASALSFILQEGAREPKPDSMRVPGSPIVLIHHEPVAISVLNRARNPVTVHWHGIELQSYFDGVGGWSGAGDRIAPVIAPGDSFVVRITPSRAGTFIYHSHQDEVEQLGAGLFGPLIILNRGEVRDTTTDKILLMGSGGPQPDAPPSLNGHLVPPPIDLRQGVRHRLRFIGIAAGEAKAVRLLADTALQRWRAIGKDGADLPPHQATLRPAQVALAPGETWDFEYMPADTGSLTLEIVTTGRGLPPTTMRVPVHVRAGSR